MTSYDLIWILVQELLKNKESELKDKTAKED